MVDRDQLAANAIVAARVITGFYDEAALIVADGTEGGLELLALGVLALEQENRELPPSSADRRSNRERGC